MSQQCVRCVVKLGLNELHWENGSGSPIHLDGPPVFLRACVLGQLQHSHLHHPLFPLHLHQTLTFDRVFTNCAKPSLLKEVVTGEHVRIELIQVSEDYKGGKILARYETPARTFLFPDPPMKKGELRVAALCKSRKYQHPPQLTFTSSTTLTAATTHTTLRSPTKPSLRAFDKSAHPATEIYPDPPPSTLPMSTQNEGITTRDKLHALLSSYTKPHSPPAREEEEKTKPRIKIKFKPPVPKFTHSKKSEAFNGGKKKFTSAPKPLYHCCTAFLGPHSWETCPRRSRRKTAVIQQQRTRSKSVPSSPMPKRSCLRHKSSHTLPQSIPWSPHSMTIVQTTRGAFSGLCPPFVAGRADPRVLEKRDFCGQYPQTVVRHFSTAQEGREGEKEGGEQEFGGGGLSTVVRQAGQLSTEQSQRIYSQWLHGGRGTGLSQPGVCQHYPMRWGDRDSHKPVISAPHTAASDGQASQEEEDEASEESSAESSLSQEESEEPFDYTSQTPSPPLTLDSLRPPLTTSFHPPSHPSFIPLPHPHPPSTTHLPPPLSTTHLPPPPSTTPLPPPLSLPRQPSAHQDLLLKYLGYQPGNRRAGVGSPGRVIVGKLERLIQECCDCRHTAESLGEDDMSEDLARLKASLSAEREDALNRSARLIPQQSILVRLGVEGEDYWSRRAAEFQGKPHRLVFNETLEKIYHRLYQNATQIH